LMSRILRKSASAKKTVIWFVWFLSFVWLNETNQINKTNQFEHPARDVAVRRELPKLLGIVSEEGWSGYRSKKNSGRYAAILVRSRFTSTWAKMTSGSR
jgi:hypothetical protein